MFMQDQKWLDSYYYIYHAWNKKLGHEKVLLVHYEDMMLNLEHELIRILDFLDVKVSEKVLKCVIEEHSTGNFKRGRKVQFDAQTLFSEDNLNLLKEMKEKLLHEIKSN